MTFKNLNMIIINNFLLFKLKKLFPFTQIYQKPNVYLNRFWLRALHMYSLQALFIVINKYMFFINKFITCYF